MVSIINGSKISQHVLEARESLERVAEVKAQFPFELIARHGKLS